MFVNRTYGVAAATLGVLFAGACSDPELNTDLRPEGDPEVLAVLVMTDPSAQLIETATYCKPHDDFRPGLVGLPDFTTQVVCPEDDTDPPEVTDAYPDGWYVRIMFDELLDPSIEELTPVIDSTTGEPTGASTGSIAAAHPVTLQCRSATGTNDFVNVDYDGYYSPSGNRVTWPVGPSLVIKPNDPTTIATNTECQITLTDAVHDKDGHPVPEDQRGPFPFKIAPITAIVSDPPSDDPDFEAPVDAVTFWYDNAYVQFNTEVDVSSICPDEDDDGNCDDDVAFSFHDVEHPSEGPGYCADYSATCGTSADCGGTQICGKGVCSDGSTVCNTAADCASGEHCNSTYLYNYVPYGSTATEFGIGPWNPLQTDRKYTFELKEGTVLRDRCGRETTFGAPSADDLTLAHFITNAFDFNGTTIVTGEVASANKRLEYDFNNVLEGFDGTLQPAPANWTSNFTISPMPKALTGACNGTTCPVADIAPADLLTSSVLFNGQMAVNGHLQMDTEYTATLKAGTVVKDFYNAEYTVPEDIVITWKTQPSITMTGIAVRNADTAFSTGNNGTLVKDGAPQDIRFSFNASIDPTTFGMDDVKIIDAATGTDVTGLTFVDPSGCGDFANNATGYYPGCTIKLEGDLPAGDYTITFKKDAVVKDIFGATLTQPADSSITVTVADAPAPTQCL